MELTTERLVLRHFTPGDFEDWFPLDQDPRVMRYIQACKPKPISEEEARKRFQYILGYYEKHPGQGVFATCLKDNGRLIGWTALKDLDGSEWIEVGYRYFFEYWGKGYATEAAAALIGHGFSKLGLPAIAAVTHPENSASRNVLKKLGFELIGPAHYYQTDVVFFKLERNP